MTGLTELWTRYTELWTRYTELWTRGTQSPFHSRVELHQKDLRILPVFLHILGPGNQLYLEADTFLALFLIVVFSVSRGS